VESTKLNEITESVGELSVEIGELYSTLCNIRDGVGPNITLTGGQITLLREVAKSKANGVITKIHDIRTLLE